jgi:hypothetical protein
MMDIAALSTAGFSQYVASSSNVSTSQRAWQSLQQSLASGNRTAAQSAFNTYQQLNQNSTGSSSTSGSQLSTDMTALGSALGSGNLATAQSAFATVQGDLKNTPSQAMATANAAVAQTVQWVDDLLSLGSSSGPSSVSTSSSTDPAYAILASSMGVDSSQASTDPTYALLESKYGPGASAPGTSSAAGSAVASSGNAGSSASVNAYA